MAVFFVKAVMDMYIFQTYMTTKQGKDQELTPTDPLFTAIGFEEKNVSKVKVCQA